jgi:hypothetical protein
VQLHDRTPVFSPVCDCPTRVGTVRFKLTQNGRLRVFVVNGNGKVIRTLESGRKYRHNLLHFAWDGRTDAGNVAHDGQYYIKVGLGGGLRPVTFPSAMRVDTKPPAARITHVNRTVIDRKDAPAAQSVTLAYRVNERAKVFLLVNGKVRAEHKGMPTQGQLTWSTRVNGKPVKPGTYHLALYVRDRAGNLVKKRPAVVVHIKKSKPKKHPKQQP